MRKRHVPATRGGQALLAWLKREERSQSWLAKRLDVHQTTVSIWLEKSEPSASYGAALEVLTGIPVAWWGLPADGETGPRFASTGTDSRNG